MTRKLTRGEVDLALDLAQLGILVYHVSARNDDDVPPRDREEEEEKAEEASHEENSGRGEGVDRGKKSGISPRRVRERESSSEERRDAECRASAGRRRRRPGDNKRK